MPMWTQFTVVKTLPIEKICIPAKQIKEMESIKKGGGGRHHTQMCLWGLKCHNWSSWHKKYKLFLNRNKLWSVKGMVLGPWLLILWFLNHESLWKSNETKSRSTMCKFEEFMATCPTSGTLLRKEGHEDKWPLLEYGITSLEQTAIPFLPCLQCVWSSSSCTKLSSWAWFRAASRVFDQPLTWLASHPLLS